MLRRITTTVASQAHRLFVPRAAMLSQHRPALSAHRFFATDLDITKRLQKSQISRISIEEPRANTLIKAIAQRDYKQAVALVESGVNVNGHNRSENTPLTDAAARGDTEGVTFLLTKLRANPHASCDCPFHKTALHYAAENGHVETVAVLLKHGAQANALDSRKYTALDVAKTPAVKAKLLEFHSLPGKVIAEDRVKVHMYLPR
jgi:ankyrin repeat protein